MGFRLYRLWGNQSSVTIHTGRVTKLRSSSTINVPLGCIRHEPAPGFPDLITRFVVPSLRRAVGNGDCLSGWPRSHDVFGECAFERDELIGREACHRWY